VKGIVDDKLRALLEVHVGKEYRTQVVANEGAHPLLGTMLLDGHDLSVSYKRRQLTLD